MRYRCTEHLCLGCYDEVSGVAQRRGAPLAPGAITVYLGGENEEYEARFSEGSVAVASSITISPDYYRDYLQSRFGEIEDVRKAFAGVDGRRDLPGLVDLLRKARSYRGGGDRGGSVLRRSYLRIYRPRDGVRSPAEWRQAQNDRRGHGSSRLGVRVYRSEPWRRFVVHAARVRTVYGTDEDETALQEGDRPSSSVLRGEGEDEGSRKASH